jgi:hypothetical protein
LCSLIFLFWMSIAKLRFPKMRQLCAELRQSLEIMILSELNIAANFACCGFRKLERPHRMSFRGFAFNCHPHISLRRAVMDSAQASASLVLTKTLTVSRSGSDLAGLIWHFLQQIESLQRQRGA